MGTAGQVGRTPGSRVVVERRKWPDRPHYRFDHGTVMGEDEFGVWIASPPQPAFVGTEAGFISRTWAALLVPHSGGWWAAFLAGAGAFDIYVDIGTVPQWEPGRVWMFDLDLDVIRWIDRGVEIADRDEFVANAAAYDYPQELVEEANRTAEQLRRVVEAEAEPFGDVAREWLAQVSALSECSWFHGSPSRLDVLRLGSTISRDLNIARVFSHKPSLVARDDHGQISHNGTSTGFLYEVPGVDADDVYPHPQTTMDPGVEWLTTRELPLTLIGETAPLELELLTPDDEALLRRQARLLRVSIREMTESDVADVARMCAAVLRETWLNPNSLEDVIEANGSTKAWTRYVGSRKCFVAHRDGELVGAAWVFVNGRTAHVGGAFVRHRGEGIGGALLRCRLEFAVEQGCENAHATVIVGNLASRRNLERHGFTLSAESDQEWTFEKQLTDSR